MEPISYSLRDVLVRQGIANGRAGTRASGGMKGRGAASDGARSQVKADAGEEPHRPIGPHAGGGKRDQLGNSGKGRAVNAPAKFTGLRLVSSRCLDTANPTREPRAAVSKHLMLVVSN